MIASKVLQIDPRDSVLIALEDLLAGQAVFFKGEAYLPTATIPAKHKLAMAALPVGAHIRMYGGVVGSVREAITRRRIFLMSMVFGF